MEQGVSENQRKELEKDFESLTEWINNLLGIKIQKKLIDLIGDGVLLCKIVNKIRPGTIRSFHQSPTNIARRMENIGFFMNACQRRFEISSSQLFEPASVQFLSSANFDPLTIGTLHAVAAVLTSLRRFAGDFEQKYSPRQSNLKQSSTPAQHLPELCTQAAIIDEILSVIHHELSYKHQQALANRILDEVDELQKKLLVLSDDEIKEFAHKAGLDCDRDTRAECIGKILLCRELM
jgi:hypothetical protein